MHAYPLSMYVHMYVQFAQRTFHLCTDKRTCICIFTYFCTITLAGITASPLFTLLVASLRTETADEEWGFELAGELQSTLAWCERQLWRLVLEISMYVPTHVRLLQHLSVSCRLETGISLNVLYMCMCLHLTLATVTASP